ncbi:hypothetical protein BU24DRAFT_249516 [Aaosphaeria arxii CBS 175.79]|uniref:Uncharacterized protein n=1 Tax=Aaosphaeria arxii CBS 175.79 TaxID=1450172 RepID=A0A6A5XLW3_9PLEO|nr:uncharacterized protein BU24DRAFT_249516 [Aaosphaeria arxii CBS 175.79]KAF2013906.1 hypothetical protein BU24DRAFT_249516 [Aaosphaeria arxii CBS 175.79]
MHTQVFSIRNYTRIDSKGTPTFTMFINIPKSISEGVRQKWQEIVQHRPKYFMHPLYDHHEIFQQSLHKLRHDLVNLQLAQSFLAEQRLEMHIMSTETNIDETMRDSHSFTKLIIQYQFSLEVVQKTVLNLHEELESFKHHLQGDPSSNETEEYMRGRIAYPLSEIWSRNITRQFCIVQSKLKDIAEVQGVTQASVLSYIAQRDSGALAHNTEQMAHMAKVTEVSGQEIHAMTRRMENDARQMKFLAEITAFFLPLTALAVSFI